MKKFYIFFLLIFLVQLTFGQTFSSDKLSKHVHYLASEELEGRALGTAGKDKATAYILDHFQSAGLQPFFPSYKQEFELKIDLAWLMATNVVGLVEGSDPALKQEYIVLGAHYDHLGRTRDSKDYYPGADDNASGVATLLELASYYGKPENRPKRSLIFIAFDAEESGLNGSKYFVDHLATDTLIQIKAMFSFDMVGMLSKNGGLGLKGIGTLANGKELAHKHARELQVKNVSSLIEMRTDTDPFGKKGIPAIHVYTGSKSPYHKPADKADLLDYPGMEKVAQYTADLVDDLASQPEILAISSMDVKRGKGGRNYQRFTYGLTFGLGSSSHLYKEEFFDAKEDAAASGGVRLQYRFHRQFSLSLEGLYNYNSSQSAQQTFSREGIMVPLNLQFGTNFYVFAGAYYTHYLKAKIGDQKLDFKDSLRKQEWGANYGVGINYLRYDIRLQGTRGFQSIYKNGPKVIPRGFYISFTYNL